MVLPREVFHRTSVRVPNQDTFKHNIINTKALPLFKKPNLHHKDIILKAMTIISFLVYYVFNADLYAITIYQRIKNLDNLNKPAIQEFLTFLRGCMTRIPVNNTGTFIPSSVFMDSTPPAARTWGINKLNITVTTL